MKSVIFALRTFPRELRSGEVIVLLAAAPVMLFLGYAAVDGALPYATISAVTLLITALAIIYNKT